MIRGIISIALFLFVIQINSQESYTIKNKKAIKLFEQAVYYYEKNDDLNAVAAVMKAVEIEPVFVEAYNLLAQIYEDRRDYEKAMFYYQKSIEIAPDFSYLTYYLLAQWQLKLGMYSETKANLEACLEFENISPRHEALSNEMMKYAEFGINAIKNPVPFNPVNLGTNVNTEYDDYWPSLTVDGEILITTVLLPIDSRFPITPKNAQEDFFITYKKDNDWTKAANMGTPVNTQGNEGAQSFSVDGRFLFYTVCNRMEDFGSCDIYFSQKVGNKWTDPKNIGQPINSSAWESTPCFSANGKTLFFSADHRRGGSGGKDLWMSVLQGDGSWSDPENLGDKINSQGNETAPFIHPDNNTLYFCSDGHMGMGGMDIFVSKKDSKGDWQAPVNLGYPINTFRDEIGMIVNAYGDLAYYSAEKDGSRRKDIYMFELPKIYRPGYVTYVKGKIYDAVTKEPLFARFELLNLETEDLVMQSYSNKGNGQYIVCLPVENDYVFNASKEGYLFYSENFSLKNLSSKGEPFVMDIPLQPIAINATIELKNIFYDTDQYTLKAKSKVELNKMIDYLVKNPNLSIEIGGHTDNVGTKEYNQKLSENRSKTVYQYLIDAGINKSHLSFKGYNFSQPRYPNDTDANRAKNRRTELKIVKID
ncbi:MAG: OmpA family protein [Bacteroidota bacterium]